MRGRPGQIATPAIIVISIFAVMFFGTVTFFVYQFQRGSSNKNTTKNENVNKKSNKNTNTAVNTNTATAPDRTPHEKIPDTWKTYTNTTVGYSLRYPATWSVEESVIPDHPIQKITVRYITLKNPGTQLGLIIGVRRVGDAFSIGERTTAPDGEMKAGIPITIGQTTIPTTDLLVDGKTTATFYHPLKPFGFAYLEGREVQAELGILSVPGVKNTVTDLLAAADTQIANTIMTTLRFTDVVSPLTPPPPSAPPLGQYSVETYRKTPTSKPDTRLVNLDGGKRKVVIESTRAQAGLAAGFGLLAFAFPAYGTTLYFQEQELKTGAISTAIWSYDTASGRLTKQAYPAVGWGKVVTNRARTRTIYVSSTNRDDSGDIKTMYHLDLITNTLTSIITLRDTQTFSSGWGGTTNAFNFTFKSTDVATYTFYDQTTGNKQTKLAKTKLGDGQIVLPGADPSLQR